MTVPGAINVFQTEHLARHAWHLRYAFMLACIICKLKWFVYKQSAIEFHDDVDDDNTANPTVPHTMGMYGESIV